MLDLVELLSVDKIAWLNQHHLTCDVVALTVLLAGFYRNWLWRAVCIGASVVACALVPGAEQLPTWLFVVFAAVVFSVPPLRHFAYFRDQPEKGCVFVTGADSGMGEATVLHLSTKPYALIFAGCFVEASAQALKAKVAACGGDASKVIAVQLDVTSDESVKAAADAVRAQIASRKPEGGLVGVINCAGMGFNGPAEYFPMDMYKRQMDVNFFGYVRITQQFLPLLKAASLAPGGRRGRLVYIGTGGGILSPAPPLLTAYMASKWAIEAFCRCTRVELQLRELPIDCCMVNPGFVKPTMLMSEGLKLNTRMWDACAASLGSNIVRRCRRARAALLPCRRARPAGKLTALPARAAPLLPSGARGVRAAPREVHQVLGGAAGHARLRGRQDHVHRARRRPPAEQLQGRAGQQGGADRGQLARDRLGMDPQEVHVWDARRRLSAEADLSGPAPRGWGGWGSPRSARRAARF